MRRAGAGAGAVAAGGHRAAGLCHQDGRGKEVRGAGPASGGDGRAGEKEAGEKGARRGAAEADRRGQGQERGRNGHQDPAGSAEPAADGGDRRYQGADRPVCPADHGIRGDGVGAVRPVLPAGAQRGGEGQPVLLVGAVQGYQHRRPPEPAGVRQRGGGIRPEPHRGHPPDTGEHQGGEDRHGGAGAAVGPAAGRAAAEGGRGGGADRRIRRYPEGLRGAGRGGGEGSERDRVPDQEAAGDLRCDTQPRRLHLAGEHQ